jgi:hypothetical protein
MQKEVFRSIIIIPSRLQKLRLTCEANYQSRVEENKLNKIRVEGEAVVRVIPANRAVADVGGEGGASALQEWIYLQLITNSFF